jgi:transglutaminase-like putative cysteine protease
MVEIRGRLVEQSDAVMFEVRSDEAAYWRLTSLDRFDGEIWSSDSTFRPAARQLPSEVPPTTESTAIDQQIRIRALSAIWVPVAFEAVSLLDASRELRWDADSSTLIVDSSQPSSDGLTYSAISRAPTFDPEQLRRSAGSDPTAIRARYGGVPAGFPDEAVRLAAAGMRRAAGEMPQNRYEQALALQEWFRQEFRYSLEVPPGHSDDALLDFLDRGQGYCEQFAGAFAAIGRAFGWPTRVAVGFTPGAVDPADPGRFIVQGRHAHAWPEVYFPEVGWVPFEPTPGRGMPGAQGHTGVAPEQDAGTVGDPAAATTTSPSTSTTAPASTSTPTEPGTAPDEVGSAAAPTTDERDGDRSSSPALPLVAATLGLAGVAAAAWWLRRRQASARALDPVDRSWQQVVQQLVRAGLVVPSPAETPAEVAARARDELSEAAPERLGELADAVTAARYAPEAMQQEATERVTEIAAEVLAPSS